MQGVFGLYWAEVTEKVDDAIERLIAKTGPPITAEEVVRSPHCLVGPLGALQERVHALRERWGISYLSLRDRNAAGCATLVEAMAGR